MIKFFCFILMFCATVTANFSYYILAVQKWCSTEYMIHGLWPQISASEYPTYCMNDIYIEPSGTLKKEMDAFWSSCDNSDLWKHEWLKHGTCVEEQYKINEDDYYNMTLNMFIDNMNLLDKCNDKDDCTLGCFDLNLKLIDCPEN